MYAALTRMPRAWTSTASKAEQIREGEPPVGGRYGWITRRIGCCRDRARDASTWSPRGPRARVRQRRDEDADRRDPRYREDHVGGRGEDPPASSRPPRARYGERRQGRSRTRWLRDRPHAITTPSSASQQQRHRGGVLRSTSRHRSTGRTRGVAQRPTLRLPRDPSPANSPVASGRKKRLHDGEPVSGEKQPVAKYLEEERGRVLARLRRPRGDLQCDHDHDRDPSDRRARNHVLHRRSALAISTRNIVGLRPSRRTASSSRRARGRRLEEWRSGTRACTPTPPRRAPRSRGRGAPPESRT